MEDERRPANVNAADSVAITEPYQRSRPFLHPNYGSVHFPLTEGGSVPPQTSIANAGTSSPTGTQSGISHQRLSSTQTSNDGANLAAELPRPGDGTDSMIGAIGASSSNLEFFGKSSAGSFMRQITAGIDSSLVTQSSNGDDGAYSSSNLTQPSQRLFKPHGSEFEYVLPSRKTADSLAENYWNSTHLVYPFLDRASLEKDYRALWTGSPMNLDERIVIGTINMVFALGAQVSKAVAPEQRQEIGRMYYDRAQNAIDDYIWDTASVDLVSYLLLTGVFLQTTNVSRRCWMVIGHAIRMAQSLGLHLLRPSIRTQSRRKAEVTRRVWHGCILMDRVLSMTFGRPAMISNHFFSAVPLPLAIDDEFLDTQGEGSMVRPDGHPCLMAFYPSQVQFYDIVNDILIKLYMNSGESQESVYDIATVLQLDKALIAWVQNLPSQLQEPCPPHLQGSPFQRLGIVNKIRLCLKDAHQIIELVYNNLDFNTVTGPLPSWWYCVLYIYTAAIVLLAQRLQPILADGICDFSVDVSWNRSIEILVAYARVGASAKQCVAALEALSVKNPWEPRAEASQRSPAPDTVPNSPMPLPSGILWDDAGLDDSGFDFNDMYWLHNFPGIL
ncbi:fungal-specific transcription factor domain-containing protein [Penicillium malachiteum]|uniref:Fungal-specific transcription factor domain-containing protein n=1 Tax=Penicillium malachiteum TaxID=1324776 RepID=A0AAD6HX55_9EURO|nr:fungal-specific transcription factor domain-containing protein [Penicillium malachiteum]